MENGGGAGENLQSDGLREADTRGVHTRRPKRAASAESASKIGTTTIMSKTMRLALASIYYWYPLPNHSVLPTPTSSSFFQVPYQPNTSLSHEHLLLDPLVGVSPRNPPEKWVPEAVFGRGEAAENQNLHPQALCHHAPVLARSFHSRLRLLGYQLKIPSSSSHHQRFRVEAGEKILTGDHPYTSEAIYILRRCVAMLLCWPDHSIAD
ncbi:hypothetical protein RJ640_024260 [Escallonia rubra]|uniref:Uncharacterized protein n=1 Tax=Escallonia rubra TaxID=112253 RepID=A0AA88UK42_9ASTE|nr:hypothetical protein RJ640_024260 [Escallonia rubra]